MIHLRHIHTHTHHYSIDYTPPNIWLICLQHRSMPTHKFADQTTCCFYFIFIFLFLITPSYILRPLDITASRGSILYVQTSFLVLCVWNVQVSIKEQMYNINIWIWPRFLPLHFFLLIIFFLNAVSLCHQCISPGKARQTSTFGHWKCERFGAYQQNTRSLCSHY